MKNSEALSGFGLKDAMNSFSGLKQKAVARLHKAEINRIHSDEKGLYRLYPDGSREYLKSDPEKSGDL